ncbi:MAG: SCP2 sterol-binding domain-containing protein [Burkholderiales bacterium]|jgi:putative sterol carrier protein|nr:SCP2 sterol-binding domain-containing protein [Burkholderiales bacterium]
MQARNLFAAAALAAASAAHAQGVMMSPDWAKGMCAAWNADPVLTTRLVESGWVKNDKGRGFKVMQIYRSDCPESPRIELRVSQKDGKAICTYGGKAETKVDTSADYMMWAETRRWVEMGKGEYGPMRAMMLNRLTFDGPMGEAMGNMGPFEGFLLLVGKVPGDTKACPAK